MQPTKSDLLYSGKAKSVFNTSNPDYMIMEFRNDTSAFDGKKVEQLDRKGMVNNYFNAHVMQLLNEAGIVTHFEEILSEQESLVKRLDMIPLECVIRNISAGSLSKRLGVEEGLELNPPTFELFLKNDELGDPMVNEYHAASFGWAKPEHISKMKELSFKVNEVLQTLFAKAGILLVDYKLEFGLFKGEICLGDEFSPDGCRLWDAQTREKLDKDRFRKNMGNVVESYEQVAERIGVKLPN